VKPCKPSGPSRRGLIAGAAAAPLLVASDAPSKRPVMPKLLVRTPPNSIDPVVELARHSLALHRENERLHRRYGTVEAWLADNHDWFRLSEAEQRVLPAGRKLYDIQDRWAVLDKERPRSLRHLRRTPATSLEGVIGKLQVVAAAIEPDEFPSAHRLLNATINDLRMLRQGS
jgi:hypothetical protein